MKTWNRLVLILMMLGSILGCRGNAPLPPIVVGHVATLTGPDKRPGMQASLGINLALEEINKDAERRIEVRHTDALSKLDSFETQAIRLLAVNQARALLGGNRAAEVERLDRAVQPETRDQPLFVPIFTPCGGRSRSMSKQVVATGMTPQAQGKVLVRHAMEELKVESLALLVDQTDEQARTLAEVVARDFQAAHKPGGEPVRARTLPYGTGVKLADLFPLLLEEMPHAVLVAGGPAEFRQVHDMLMQHAAKSKQMPPILLFGGGDGVLRPGDWPTLHSDGSMAIYLASAFGVEKDNAALESFVQRFRKQFQEEPDVHAALAHENIKLLAEPLRRTAAPAEHAKLREEVFKTKDFPGLAGPLNFDADQNVIRSLFVLRLDRDQLTVMKKYGP